MSQTRMPALVLLLALLPATADGQQVSKKVLLIGIDGVRVDILAGARTPTIDSLKAAGFFSDEAKTRGRTMSGPGWSSMLTGVWTAKHRVNGNDLSGNDYAAWPDFLTRIERLRPERHTFAVIDWPPLGTTDSGGPLLSDAIDVKRNLDGERDGYRYADSASVELAAAHLSSADVDAAFVYLGEVDVLGHATNSRAAEYREAIERADAHVAQLLAALRSRPEWEAEDWLILLGTDHGRNDAGGHGGGSPSETTIFYLASGPSVEAGRPDCPPEIVDVAATALAHLGLGPDPVRELDGRVRGLRGSP